MDDKNTNKLDKGSTCGECQYFVSCVSESNMILGKANINMFDDIKDLKIIPACKKFKEAL